jgi:hypothetical protein
MQSQNKICLIMLGLVAQLVFFGYVAAKPLKGRDHPSGQEIRLPATAPEWHTLTLVSFSPLVVEGKIVGTVAGTIPPPKGLSITGNSTTVKAASRQSVGLIDSASKGWL